MTIERQLRDCSCTCGKLNHKYAVERDRYGQLAWVFKIGPVILLVPCSLYKFSQL